MNDLQPMTGGKHLNVAVKHVEVVDEVAKGNSI